MKYDIVLINCYSGNPAPPDAPPYGLLYVGSDLKRSGYSVKIYDRQLNVHQSVDSFGQEVLGSCKRIICLGGVAAAYKDAIELAEFFKRNKDDVFIIAGGYIGSTYRTLLYKAPIDAIVRGEGEETASELVHALLNNKSLDDVQGLYFLKNNNICRTQNRRLIDNLDDIPFPDYSLIPLEKYLLPGNKAPYFRFDERSAKYTGVFMDIKTSRGCTNHCSFCYRHMKGMRHHSPEYVLNHMEYLQKNFKADFFNISDELTISDAEWVDKFCRLKKERNLDFLFRINAARVDIITEEMLSKLKAAGMIGIIFGIESGSQTMLDNMRKNTTVEQNLKVLRLCQKLDLQTTITLVIGLPGENNKTILESLQFLIKAPHNPLNQESEYDDMNDLRLFTPIAFPDTPLYKQGKNLGIIKDEHEYLLSLNDNTVMRSYNFTSSSNFMLKLWINVLNYTYRACYFLDNRKFIKLFALLGEFLFKFLKKGVSSVWHKAENKFEKIWKSPKKLTEGMIDG